MNHYIHQGHLVRKRFSQNFLNDSHIVKSIVTAIHPKSNQTIVEIGPGLGVLTEKVASYVDRITIIEIDRDLINHLINHPILKSKLNIIPQDVMTVDFSELYTKQSQLLRVFGNLPYNISTLLIFHILNYIHVIHDMHFMLQKEVVNRLMARPGNKIYGRLSVMAQYYCQITQILEVPATSFRPIPKVDSAIVKLVPHDILPFPACDPKKLAIVTSLAFHQRRKMLRNSLNNLFNTKQLMDQNIEATLRAENVSIEQYCRLANALAERFTSKG